jgi:hypothetical protein
VFEDEIDYRLQAKFSITHSIYFKKKSIRLSERLEVGELLEDSLLGDPELVDEASDGNPAISFRVRAHLIAFFHRSWEQMQNHKDP